MSDPFRRLQLRHFRLIAALTELGQLSRAADHLAMTQPAASRMLAEIERLIDAPLFERHPKGMRPTAMGAALSRHAGVLLSRFDEAAKEVEALRSGRAGSVRVGAVTGAALGFVAPAIHALRDGPQPPEIRVDVAPSVDLMAGLLNGEYDFVLCRVPPGVSPERLQVLRGRVEHMEIMVRAGHPLCRQPDITLNDLRDMPWVMQSRGMPVRDTVQQSFHAQGLAPPGDVVETASLLMTIGFLHTSDAVAPVARELADLLRATGTGGMETLAMKDRITVSPYHLIRQRGHPLSPIAQRFLDLVMAELTT